MLHTHLKEPAAYTLKRAYCMHTPAAYTPQYTHKRLLCETSVYAALVFEWICSSCTKYTQKSPKYTQKSQKYTHKRLLACFIHIWDGIHSYMYACMNESLTWISHVMYMSRVTKIAAQCSTLQHTATLQHSAALQLIVSLCNTLQYLATH